jgi:RNA polymerase sigma factor (sigma-70 family)
MSPLSVRRYRAERLLHREFESLRGRVLATVRARLRAAGVSLDAGDLDDCYAQAWHGLYTTMLEGASHDQIASPAGWLTLVTYRRAIDEHRSRSRSRLAHAGLDARSESLDARGPAWEAIEGGHARERDLAQELDDRVRLRQLLEGLRGRLNPRERQAAALCYLQGLSRADAAARMGVSQARMRKLMEGSRAGSPGVAGKVGELLDTIRAGSYCAEQSSLMRGFAFGILDPEGERYALALAHQRECPACRAHVLSLRGLASVLPPLPLPLVLGAGVAAGASAGATTTGAGAGAGMGAGVSGTGVSAGGAAGGGWLLAGGGVGAKLAVGCLVAVGVGAGCAALTIAPGSPHRPAHHRHVVHVAGLRAYEAQSPSSTVVPPSAGVADTSHAGASRSASAIGASAALTPAARAEREFGPEQPSRRVAAEAASSATEPRAARVASAGSSVPQAQPRSQSTGHESGGPSAAEREFGLR